MTTPPTPLINWHAIGDVFAISVVVGVGLVLLFTTGVHSLSVARRPGLSAGARTLAGTVLTLATAAVAATVAAGLYFIVHK